MHKIHSLHLCLLKLPKYLYWPLILNIYIFMKDFKISCNLIIIQDSEA